MADGIPPDELDVNEPLDPGMQETAVGLVLMQSVYAVLGEYPEPVRVVGWPMGPEVGASERVAVDTVKAV